eukprot:14898471-Heterocapsa_arctica.AAC.1
MHTQLSEDELGEILHGKMCNSKELSNDLAHYQRQPLNHLDRSYKFLMASMERNILDGQMKRNRANDAAAIRGGN